MKEFLGEFIGTALLVILGNGVVAGVLLNQSKAQNAGWLVICFAWGLAVMMAIYAAGSFSGAHLNPAVTIALTLTGNFDSSLVAVYLLGQFAGAFVGAFLVFIHYYPHWEKTEDPALKLAVFCTSPAINKPFHNFVSEFIASFILMFGLMALGSNSFAAGLNPFIIGVFILSIGLSLGGTTGWAINPARDFSPRLAHYLLPIPGKGASQWKYAWIPVVAPVLGCVTGGFVFDLMQKVK